MTWCSVVAAKSLRSPAGLCLSKHWSNEWNPSSCLVTLGWCQWLVSIRRILYSHPKPRHCSKREIRRRVTCKIKISSKIQHIEKKMRFIITTIINCNVFTQWMFRAKQNIHFLAQGTCQYLPDKWVIPASRTQASLWIIPPPPCLEKKWVWKTTTVSQRPVILRLLTFKDKTLPFILKNNSASFHSPASGNWWCSSQRALFLTSAIISYFKLITATAASDDERSEVCQSPCSAVVFCRHNCN